MNASARNPAKPDEIVRVQQFVPCPDCAPASAGGEKVSGAQLTSDINVCEDMARYSRNGSASPETWRRIALMLRDYKRIRSQQSERGEAGTVDDRYWQFRQIAERANDRLKSALAALAQSANDTEGEILSALQRHSAALSRPSAERREGLTEEQRGHNWIEAKRCIRPTHEAADAFWKYWRENGETHKHGYYESTWGAINAALNSTGQLEQEK
jgi:hypothetical protein